MTFKELVESQKLSEIEEAYADHTAKRWDRFSNTVGVMGKSDVLKILKYLLVNRPNSKTLIVRAVQRFNTLNKVKAEDLTNGNRETSRSVPEEKS